MFNKLSKAKQNKKIHNPANNIFNLLLSRKFTDIIIPAIILLTTFSVYIQNLSPTVFGGDSGDILSAIISKGVPHPSGYPLYTIIGIFFNSLPLGHSSAWRIGLSSSLFAALSVVFFYLTSHEITKNRFIALITSLSLAFLYPFWIYAEVVEVFSLHCFFIILITFLTIRYLNTKHNNYLLKLAFVSGLSLTNNQTIILLFPSVALTLLLSNPKILKEVKLLIKGLLLFLLGLIPYVYIPIAASKNPVVNWDRAVTVNNFLYLILRKDYGWVQKNFQISSISGTLKGIYVYWSEYMPLLIPLLFIFGLFGLKFKRTRLNIMFFLVSIILFGPFFLIYASTPTNNISNLAALERFYIPPMIFLLLISSVGIVYLIQLADRFIINKTLYKTVNKIILLIISILPISLYLQNINKTNLNQIYIGENIGIDILRPLNKDSFLFVSSDEFGFNTVYVQLENRFRSDVTIPGRNTGFEKFLKVSQLKTSDGVEQYLINRQNSVDQAELYGGIVSLMDRGVDIYSTVPKIINDDQIGRFVTIPTGLVYKFVKVGTELPTKEEYLKEQEKIWSDFHLNDFSEYDYVINYSMTLSTIKSHYAQSYLRIANYLRLHYKDESLFDKYYLKAVELDPVYSAYQ